MKIKLSKEKEGQIAKVLNELRPRGGVGHLSASQVLGLAGWAEGELESLDLPQCHRKGARFAFSEEGASAKSYRYAIKTTRVVIERGAKDWFLIELDTVGKWPQQRREADVYLTREQEEKVLAAFRRKYRLKEMNAAV